MLLLVEYLLNNILLVVVPNKVEVLLKDVKNKIFQVDSTIQVLKSVKPK